MTITPFPKIRLEKCLYKIKKQNKTGRALFFGSFDKQSVDFTFLSLLPMEWINKQTKNQKYHLLTECCCVSQSESPP